VAGILRLSDAAANALLDAIRVLMDAGAGAATLKLYDGTQPAGPGTAITSQVLGATLTFTDPAAAGASSRTLTFSAITQDSSADATITPTWGRIADSNGLAVFDADAGTSGKMITLGTASLTSGGPVSCSAATLTVPTTITF